MRRILLVCVLIATLFDWPSAVKGATPTALAVQELALATNGAAYEIEPDSQGRLWISEYNAGELWRVDTGGGGYQVYAVGGSPSDAHPDTSGGVWWLEDIVIHHMDTASGDLQSWNVLGSIWMWGLAITSQNKVWISDNGAGNLLYFDPDPGSNYELKTYSLPNGGMGYYPAVAGDQAWVGDAVNERLLRLDAGLDRMEWWQLPPSSSPYDVAVDPAGNIWYTDKVLSQIGKLEPAANRLTTYPLPAGHQAKMLAAARGKIWFTEETGSAASFGSLDPLSAASSTQGVDNGFVTITPWIDHLPLDTPAPAGITSETIKWSPDSTTSASSADGWTGYSLPGNAAPWGIAVTSSGWVVDKGRQMLVRFPVVNPNPGNFRVYIPAVQH